MLGRVLWPLLVVVAVILAVIVTAAGEETRAELEYLDEIRSQATDMSRNAASIHDVMSRVREIGREEFVTVFDGVASDLDVSLAFVVEEPPTDSLIPVWALYRQAVTAWDNGLTGLSTAVLRAADDPDDVTVVNVVADALGNLRTGDALYRDLQAEFERSEIPDPISPLVDVQLMPADSGLASLSASYIAAARASTNGLGLRPGLTVSQVLSQPAWQINASEQPVVPATEVIVFSAVITNSGNVASETETLTMTFTGGPEQILSQMEVPPLEPEEQTTVSFSEIPVESDTLYEVFVELVLTGPDSDLTDNTLRVQFTVNAA